MYCRYKTIEKTNTLITSETGDRLGLRAWCITSSNWLPFYWATLTQDYRSSLDIMLLQRTVRLRVGTVPQCQTDGETRETERESEKGPRPKTERAFDQIDDVLHQCNVQCEKRPEMAVLNRPLQVSFRFSYDRTFVIWASLVGWDGLPQGVRSQILQPQIEACLPPTLGKQAYPTPKRCFFSSFCDNHATPPIDTNAIVVRNS